MAGSTPSATSTESVVPKRRLGEESPPPRHKTSLETGRGGEGRKQIWEHYCSRRQIACMLSLVKTVQPAPGHAGEVQKGGVHWVVTGQRLVLALNDCKHWHSFSSLEK